MAHCSPDVLLPFQSIEFKRYTLALLLLTLELKILHPWRRNRRGPRGVPYVAIEFELTLLPMDPLLSMLFFSMLLVATMQANGIYTVRLAWRKGAWPTLADT